MVESFLVDLETGEAITSMFGFTVKNQKSFLYPVSFDLNTIDSLGIKTAVICYRI